jgi:hypothetical protein
MTFLQQDTASPLPTPRQKGVPWLFAVVDLRQQHNLDCNQTSHKVKAVGNSIGTFSFVSAT